MAIDFKEADLLQPFRWVSELFTGDTDLGPVDQFGEYVRDIDLGIPDETLVTVGKLIAYFSPYGWAIPFIEGGATLAQGGSIEDALKNAAVSYVAGKVSGAVADSAGSYITGFVGDELAETFAGTLLTEVAPDAVSSATLAAFKGEDPWEAFLSSALTSSVGNGVNAAMSKIDDATNQAFTTLLPPSAQNLIKASLESTLIGGVTGENVTEAALAKAITQSTTVTNTLSNFFGNNTNLDPSQVSALTLAVQRSAAAAFTGDSIDDALQLTLDQYGQQQFDIVTDKIVKNSIDKLQGTYQEYARVSSEISAAGVKRDTALGEFRALENRVIDAQFARDEAVKDLEDVHTRFEKGELNKTEADTLYEALAPTLVEAQASWETAYAEVITSGTLGLARTTFTDNNALVDSLSEELAEIGETLYSDTSQLDPGMQTLYSAVDKSFTLAMNPSFNEAQYKEFNNLGDDVDGYFHWLNEGQKMGLPTNADEAYAQRNTAEVALQNAVLKNLNLTAADFSKNDLASLRTLVSQLLPSGSYDPSTINLETIKNASNNFLVNSDAWKEYTTQQALINKGLVNEYLEGPDSLNLGDVYTDSFNNLLKNLGLPTGVVGETSITQKDLNGIIDSFKDINTSFVPTDVITAAEGVTGRDIADGTATLTITEDELLKWDNLKFKDRKFHPHWSPEHNMYGRYVEVEEGSDFAKAEGGQRLVFLNMDGERVSTPVLAVTVDTATIVDGEGTSLGDLKTTNPKAFITNAAALDLSDNSIADSIKELAGTTLFNTIENVKKYAEATDSGFDNWFADAVGSTIIGGGGIVGFINDAVNLMLGFDPNSSSFSAMAENIEAFGADVRSDEFNNAVKDAWDRVGEADGFLGTLKAFGGELADAPVEMLTSIIFEEMSQELLPALVTGGTATFARAAFKQMGEATAKNMASKLALTAGATTDLMESFGTAGGAMYDEAYDYLIAQGATEDEAQRGAYDRAMQSGLMSSIFTAASFGIGGLGFETKIAGRVSDSKGSFAKSYDEWVKRVGDDAKIIGKEGVSEALEEGSSTYVDELILYDLDPNRDVGGNVAIGMAVGALAGGGTVGGVTVLSNIISNINPTINNIVTTAAKTKEGAAQAGLLLANLGLDPVITNNILNTVYDAGYTSNEEAAVAFQEANPNYIPTTEELNNFAVKRNDSDLAAEVASYIGANYISASEIIAAASAEGITLTYEQAAELATKTDDKTTIFEEIISEIEADAKADAEAAAQAAAEAQAAAQAEAEAQAAAQAEAEAQAAAQAEAEAQAAAQAEAEAQAAAQAEAEAQAVAQAEAEAQAAAQAEAEAQAAAQAEAEAQAVAQAEAEAQAVAQAEAKHRQ
jgi:flagellar biosynthesis GTPase FlhF